MNKIVEKIKKEFQDVKIEDDYITICTWDLYVNYKFGSNRLVIDGNLDFNQMKLLSKLVEVLENGNYFCR